MREVITQTLYGYWNEIRGDRLAPKRFEIEPSQIASLLPDTFILERRDRKTTSFRLAGTRICENFGAEFRGINILDLVDGEDRTTLQRKMQVISRQGAVGLFTLNSQTPSGATIQWEMLILPLTHLDSHIDRFLGSVAMHQHPDWLGHEPLGAHRLIQSEIVWPEGRPHAVVAAAHHQAPFLPHTNDARIVRSERRQFRVYDGGLAKEEKI